MGAVSGGGVDRKTSTLPQEALMVQRHRNVETQTTCYVERQSWSRLSA